MGLGVKAFDTGWAGGTGNFNDSQTLWGNATDPGKLNKYDDLPAQFHANVDVTDAPFDRKFGDKPAMTDQEMKDIIAFLHTLTDGYNKGT